MMGEMVVMMMREKGENMGEKNTMKNREEKQQKNIRNQNKENN